MQIVDEQDKRTLGCHGFEQVCGGSSQSFLYCFGFLRLLDLDLVRDAMFGQYA